MKIERNKLEGLIEPFLLKQLVKEEYQVCEFQPSDLLKHTRFDLAFKLAYLQLKDKSPAFAKKLYKEHIRAFSLGSYTEPGNIEKNSIDKYYSDFEKTYESIKIKGFDSSSTYIPISQSEIIINGAHRLASSIYLNKTVECVYLNELPEPNYNYDFFYKRNVPQTLLDYVASTFTNYAKNTYIAFIWPTAREKDSELEKIVPNIFYRKSISLNYQGAHNLLSQIYYGEPWLGSIENNFQGAKGKLVECFKSFDPVRVIAFQAQSLEDVLIIKERIRELFNVGKHSVHITDTHEEAKRVAEVVFNENSLHFLNYAKPNRYPSVHGKIDKFKAFMKEQNALLDDAVLDGGTVLAIYGLRESSDIDYLSLAELEHHDTELEHHDTDKAELIYNPAYYFAFNNVKFISYSQTYKMKKNRYAANQDEKDLNDYKMMEAVLSRNGLKESLSRLRQAHYYWKIKSKRKLKEKLKELGLYNLVRSIYRGIKRVI